MPVLATIGTNPLIGHPRIPLRRADDTSSQPDRLHSGCVITFHGDRKYLPLKHVTAHATILASTSRTTLTQSFHNPTDVPLEEARYVFPLYDGVSVVSFECTIGQKVIKGVVKERTEAKKDFDAAVRRGEKAGLLEQSQEATDIFTTSLGNIGAGDDVTVNITFLGELTHDAELDGLRYTLPTSVAPRYPLDKTVSTTSTSQNVRTSTSTGLSITVDVDMASGTTIKSIQSSSHPISVNIGTLTNSSEPPSLQRASGSLSLDSTALDKDFVLHVVANSLGDPAAVLEEHSTIPNRRALLTSLVPRFSLPNDKPEVVFVCDRSGSMGGGAKIPNLVSALEIFLKSLPVGVLFNICSFGSKFEFRWSQSQTYDQHSLDEALIYVKGFDADFGGTEMLDPIRDAFARRAPDRNLEVFVLTDGEVWNQENLFDLINKSVADSHGAIRLFSLGIGKDASSSLVNGIARAGNGFSQFVGENEKMNKKVVRMLKGALTPHVQNYKLEIKYDEERDDEFELVEKIEDCMNISVDIPTGAASTAEESQKSTISLHDPNVQDQDMEQKEEESKDLPVPDLSTPRYLQAPFDIPPLFPFNRTYVYVLLSEDGVQRQPKTVILTAESKHGPLRLEIPVTSLDAKGETIHQLAARKAVQDLEEGRGWVYRAKDQQGKLIKESYGGQIKDVAKAQGVKLGVEYQVSNKWCSFVAVEGGDEKADVGDFELLPKEDERKPAFRAMMAPRMMMARAAAQPASAPVSAAAGIAGKKHKASAARAPRARLSSKAYRLSAAGTSHGFRPVQQMQQSQSSSSYSPPKTAVHTETALEDADEEEADDDDDQDMGFGSFGDDDSAASGGGQHVAHESRESTQADSPTTALASLQQYQGNWSWSDTLEKLLGVSKEQARQVRGAETQSGQDDVLATLCVVMFLKKKQAEDEDVWELFVEKAEGWALEQVGGVEEDVKRLEEALEALF